MKHMASVRKKLNVNVIWINIMKRSKNNTPQFVICVNNSEYPASLELYKIYRVLPDDDAAKDGDLRIVDESGEDYLYPADYFVLTEIPRVVEQALLKAS